jgi:hypothetical protein
MLDMVEICAVHIKADHNGGVIRNRHTISCVTFFGLKPKSSAGDLCLELSRGLLPMSKVRSAPKTEKSERKQET